jgi:hypothetical protein
VSVRAVVLGVVDEGRVPSEHTALPEIWRPWNAYQGSINTKLGRKL